MSDIDDLLADLATHPPTPPTPVGEIRGRARRRSRRRRGLAAAAVVLALAAVGAGTGAALSADDGDEIVADGGTTAPSSSAATASTEAATSSASTDPSVPVASEEPSMTLDPATGHEDGTVVRMALDEPARGPALVAQCAAEVLDVGSPNVLPWCTSPVDMQAEDLRPYTLVRTIPTPDGIVDCAEAPGRCTLGVRVGGAASADDRFAPLVFREDLPPPVEPTAVVDGDEGTVGDGDALLVTVQGVDAGDVITVAQCVPVAQPDTSETGWTCDSERDRTVTVQDGPETQLTFTAFHDVFVNLADPGGWDPGFRRCEPCQVQVFVDSRPQPITALALDMEPTDTPIRPALALDPATGPWSPGQDVEVHVTGLQPLTSAAVAWCEVVPPQGGGSSPCAGPGEEGSEQVVVDQDGEATLTGYALPATVVPNVPSCIEEPGTCGVGLHALDWFAYLAVVPLDLTG